MSRLSVHLLGGYRVDLDRVQVHGFETDKARALLAYLIVESDRPHRRESLASLLWPDRPELAARANLRQTLARVRRVLENGPDDHFLLVSSSDVQFNAASDFLLDVAELEARARSPNRRTELLPSALCHDFLAGFAVPDSEVFQAWVLEKQEYYHRIVTDILEEQNSYWEGTGDYERAAAAARLQIQVEPWLEEVHRRCMRDLALAGQRDEALRQYNLCRRALQAEFGAEPDARTRALYADIRDGRPISAPGTAGRARLRLAPTAPARFVAREAELEQLSRHLDAALRGDPRVVLVSGQAGSGKTALLEAFAAAAMAEHPALVVASVRCHPGGSADLYAPLRRLGEMFFGDLDSGPSWWIPGCDQVTRLRKVSPDSLAALAGCGCDLVTYLLPAPSILRRLTALPIRSVSGGKAPDWYNSLLAAAKSGDTSSMGRPAPASLVNLQDQFICALAALGQRHPLLLLFDDLHWADEGTASFLFRLSRDLGNCPVLTLGAYRPASVAIGLSPSPSSAGVRHPLARMINELRLSEGEIIVDLDRADGRAFVEAYVDTEPNRLGAPFRDALFAQTGGHALFTVETLRNLEARGELVKDEAGRWVARDDFDWGALPVRVEAAIAERVDRLPANCRHILSVASVQGDEFSAELIAELTHRPVPELVESLSGTLAREHRLVLPGTIRIVSGIQRYFYRFAHHLFRKYLYDELDPVQRADLHRQVAAFLAREVGGDASEKDRLSVQLAWHYEAAGMRLEAAQALYQAGHGALRLSAFREAIRRFERGLAVLDKVPPTPERARLEKELVLGLLSPQRSLKGWRSVGYQGALARARQISARETGGQQPLLLISSEVERLITEGYYEEALALVDRGRVMAEASGDVCLLPVFLLDAGMAHTLLGHLGTGLPMLESLLAWQTAERCAELRQWHGMDVSVLAMAWSAIGLWLAGYGERGLARAQEAVSAAEARDDALGLAFALASAADLPLLSVPCNPAEVAPCIERLLQLAVENGFEWWCNFAELLAGRLRLDRGEIIAGIEQMQSGAAGWHASGMQVGAPIVAVLIAGGCLHALQTLPPGQGQTKDRLLAAADTALTMVSHLPAPQDGWMAPELNRLAGELLLARDGDEAVPEALARFRAAALLAERHGTLAWELRATVSLVRLLDSQCQPADEELAEARNHLRLLYTTFTEGRSFSDLQEAARLLGACDSWPAASSNEKTTATTARTSWSTAIA